MPIAKERIVTEQIVKVDSENTAGASKEKTSKQVKESYDKVRERPKSMVQNLPQPVGDYSSFKDVTKAVQQTTSSIKGQVNDALSMPNIDVINNKLSGAAGEYNLNQNIVNSVLGVTKSILCGSGDAFMFDLSALLRALDYDFDFLRTWNICGRSKARNPIDTILKSIDNLEKQGKLLADIGPRFIRNLQAATKDFLRNANLPRSLENCLTDKAFLSGSSNIGDGISLGRLKDLIKDNSPAICRKSDAGVRTDNYIVRKTAVTPIVNNITTFDKQSMYSFAAGIMENQAIEKEILLEILTERFTGKKNSNTVNTLELIAFVKIAEYIQDDEIATSITSINKELHNLPGSENIILDKILQANQDQTLLVPSDVTNVKNDYHKDFIGASNVSAVDILETLGDDLTQSTNPVQDFNKVVTLISIADKTFKPEENIENITTCDSLSSLATLGLSTIKPNKIVDKIITEQEKVGETTKDINYLQVEDKDLDVMETVAICKYAEDHYDEPLLQIS